MIILKDGLFNLTFQNFICVVFKDLIKWIKSKSKVHPYLSDFYYKDTRRNKTIFIRQIIPISNNNIITAVIEKDYIESDKTKQYTIIFQLAVSQILL